MYFRYQRDNFGESAALKQKIEDLVSELEDPRDVILDLSSLAIINTGEARAFAQLAVALKSMGKLLRVIPSSQVRRSFAGFGLHKIGSVVLYDDEQAFVREVKKLAGQAS